MTALRAARGGKVAVELDGAAWRTLPLDAVAGTGLSVGLELDRARIRTLRRELRRSEALAKAVRALARRDRSEAELAARLERAGVADRERSEALARLREAGYVNDERYARQRAEALAGRGHGDAAIRYDLEARGVAPESIERALASLEPETSRAARAVRARGAGAATARYLAGRGFGEDAVESALAEAIADEG